MKRLLLIAYYFPPDGGGGTQRPAKFCKYLPDFGWQPIVVARALDDQRTLWNPEDASLHEEIGAATVVVRPTPAESEQPAWQGIHGPVPFLAAIHAAARRAIEQYAPEVILLTMSPFDLCVVGQRLQAETGLPVIYDLRDPWALDGWRLYGTRGQWRADHAAMVRTLATADGVIANTPESARALAAAVPDLPAERMVTITNGYDGADFDGPPPPAADDGLFRIVHTGTLHSGTLYKYRGPVGWLRRLRHYRPEPMDTSGRTALHLLRALRLLRERGHPLADRVRFVQIGPADDPTRRCVAESGVADLVEITGYLPHAESVRRVRTADAVFLPLHGLPRGRRSLIVPGKTYEYLASGRPILACLPEGDARDLVARSGRGVFADPTDPEAIAAALASLADAPTVDGERAASDQWLRDFERRALATALADFLSRRSGSGMPGSGRSVVESVGHHRG
jgi:glycosyltransferase involved in cell wall biosynthesis